MKPTVVVFGIRRRRALLFCALSCAAFACTPLRRSPGARDAVAAAERAPDPLAEPWIVRDGSMRRSQLVEVRALLTSQVDSFVRVDTLRSVLEFAWSDVPETDPPRVAGLVTDARIALGGDSLAPPRGLTLPYSFTSERRTPRAQPNFLVPAEDACDSPAAALVHGARESWLSLPDTLWLGRAWSDSTSYVTCRDGVPLTVDVRREFTPTGSRLREGQQIVLISRHSSTWVRGEGSQFGEAITLVGVGEGEAVLEVALAGGVVLRGEGSSELRLEMRGRRRLQRLVQESRVVIREP